MYMIYRYKYHQKSVLPRNNKTVTSTKHRMSFKLALTQNQALKDTMHPPVHTQHSFRIDRPAYTDEENDWLSSAVNQCIFPGKPDVDPQK